ncbi:MAG: hypothetical protein AAFO29_25680 [Actinomycetota bacterium]
MTAVAALVSVWMVGGPADAQSIEVPVEQTVIRGTPGSTVEIGSAEVPADLVGRTCEITVAVVNQESIHGGNKLIVASGDSSVEVEGIEDQAGSTTTVAGTITLGETLTASVFLAVDDISSLGSSLSVTCEPLPPADPPPPVTTVPNYTG